MTFLPTILSSISTQLLNSIWLVLGGLGLAGWIVLAIWLFIDEEPTALPAINLVALLPMGLLFCALSATNRPEAALWTWRITGIVATSTGILALVMPGGVREESAKMIVGAICCILIWLSFAIFSFVVEPVAPSSAAQIAPIAVTVVNPSQIWATITPIVFALCGGLFLLLFVLRVQSGDLPSIETNSGGIGGGLGGWRISASLTYLVGLSVFGTFLCITLLQNQNKGAQTTESLTTQNQSNPATNEKASLANRPVAEPSKSPDATATPPP